jgi:hypothetical protein
MPQRVRCGGRQTFSTFQVYSSKFLRGALGATPPYKGVRGIFYLITTISLRLFACPPRWAFARVNKFAAAEAKT